jgi:hypothetical protein
MLLCRAVIEQFRHLCKIDRHRARASSIVRKPVSARSRSIRADAAVWLAWHAGKYWTAAKYIQQSARRAPARRTALGSMARLSIIGLSRLPVTEDFH